MIGDVSSYAEIDQINASLERGGWEIRFKSLSDTDLVEANQNVILQWKGMFGTGTPEAAYRTAFNGHVMPLRFTFDRLGSIAEFIAQTSDGFLRRGWCQGIGFADTDTDPRDHYHQFDSVTGVTPERMTMGRIVRHLLGYYDSIGAPPASNPDWVAHTNLVYHATQNPHGWIDLSHVTVLPFIAGVRPDGSMRVDRFIVRETTNLWETIRGIASNEFFVAYFTKANEFYYCRHPMYQSVLPSPVMTFDSSFSVGRPVVEIHEADIVQQVRLDAVTDSGDTMHSEYPITPVHVYGNVPRESRIRCNDQTTLDEWARVKYLYENRAYTVKWQAPGLVGLLFEILDRVQISYAGTSANGVHINWLNKKFWITSITVTPNVARSGITEFELEEENT